MFNIFGKQKETVLSEKFIPETKNETEVKVVTSQDIQNEMQSKLEWLLGSNEIELVSKEVDEFESQNKEILDKANDLKMLGFNNVPSAKLAEEIHSKTAEKKKQIDLQQSEIELTKKYSLEFPMYKFVPERIFKEVRDNYDLYTAEPSRYIKEIPSKNVEEIKNFMPLAKEKWEVRQTYRSETLSVFGGGLRFNEHTYSVSIFNSESEAREYVIKNEIQPTQRTALRVSKIDTFQITAPIDHFNLNNVEIMGREIREKIQVLDPIVTHKVNGGYIIVSVWDKEAEIPEIKNNILN
jgi:hypothetical protein